MLGENWSGMRFSSFLIITMDIPVSIVLDHFSLYRYQITRKMSPICKSLLEYWKFIWHVVHNITVGKKNDWTVGREKDKDMPNTMKIGESNSCPIRAEKSVIYPSCECHTNNANASLTQMNNSLVFLVFQLHRHQSNAWYS